MYPMCHVVVVLCCCFCSNGPQKCGACIKEDIFEEPTSILKPGCVSIKAILFVFLLNWSQFHVNWYGGRFSSILSQSVHNSDVVTLFK